MCCGLFVHMRLGHGHLEFVVSVYAYACGDGMMSMRAIDELQPPKTF